MIKLKKYPHPIVKHFDIAAYIELIELEKEFYKSEATRSVTQSDIDSFLYNFKHFILSFTFLSQREFIFHIKFIVLRSKI